MSTFSGPPAAIANPRPGVLKTLGICNIVFAILSLLCISGSLMVVSMASTITSGSKVEVKTQTAPGRGVPMVASFNPFMGFEDKNFIRFTYVEDGIGLVLNLVMFATGIGLINLRRWGARWWTTLAWVRIISVVLLWGFYIVAVAPGFSETMARDVLAQIGSQGMPANRMPPFSSLYWIYSIMNLIIAVSVILITATYPVISLWLLSRPGVKAAIVDQPTLERVQP